MRASSIAGGGEHFTSERVARLGDGQHHREQFSKVGKLLTMAALHELLTGYDSPVLHDPGDQLAAAAHVQGAQTLRNRAHADPMSRSFIGDDAAPATGARDSPRTLRP